jgi:S-adenosylmethionine synthetase
VAKKLTDRQRECLMMAEPTLYGDTKAVETDGRVIRGLRNRGLIEGDMPHIYLTAAGKNEVQQLVG